MFFRNELLIQLLQVCKNREKNYLFSFMTNYPRVVSLITNYQNEMHEICWTENNQTSHKCSTAVPNMSWTPPELPPGHISCSAVQKTQLISCCMARCAPAHPYPPVALCCDLPPLVCAFCVNIVCNDTLRVHRCYYGLAAMQRSSLPPRPKEGPPHHRGWSCCFHPDQNNRHNFIFAFWTGFVVVSSENPVWGCTRT